jgi:Domain of unknown function (DUF4274)
MREYAELFRNLRPTISRGDLDAIITNSRGRFSLKSVRDIGVSLLPNQEGAVESIPFLPAFPADLSVERLQIGIPTSELLRRHPALQPIEHAKLKELGIQQFEGAHLHSGHEVTVRIRDGKVFAFDIARAGLRAEKAKRERESEQRMIAHRHEHDERMRSLANLASSRTEDDVMLVRWAGGDDASRRLSQFMVTKANPDDWHAIASTWNWDSGPEPLFWIIRSPECDKATALQAFWLAEPRYFVRYAGDLAKMPDIHLGNFYFVTEIFERWTQGFYKRAEIAYKATSELPAQAVDRRGVLCEVPPSMGTELKGRVIPLDDYAEGIPSFLWDPREPV